MKNVNFVHKPATSRRGFDLEVFHVEILNEMKPTYLIKLVTTRLNNSVVISWQLFVYKKAV